QYHAADEQVAVAEEAPAQIAAEQVQAVVECAEYARDRCRIGRAEVQVLGGVQVQREVDDRKTQGREYLDEEQRSRALWYVRKALFDGCQSDLRKYIMFISFSPEGLSVPAGLGNWHCMPERLL